MAAGESVAGEGSARLARGKSVQMHSEPSETQNEFAREFSDEKFREKLLRHAKSAGTEVVERALQLYYALDNRDTPKWAKTVIIGALGYFITPLDAIPDMVPAAGYSDDLGVLALALATVAFCITPAVKAKAKQKLSEWFDRKDDGQGKNAPDASQAD